MFSLERIGNIVAGIRKFMTPISLLALMLVVIGFIKPSASQNTVNAAANVGYQDMNYKTSGVSEPTAQKPQSKLWYNDGQWWGDFYSKDAGEYRIYALDWNTQTWADTGVALDDRERSWADVLWDGTHLYVASGSNNDVSRLYRYSYSSGTYSLDAGYPVQITSDSMEALVFAKDSTGTLWITYTKGAKVYVAHSNGTDDSWDSPYVIPVTEATGLFNDDISSIVTYNGHVGVMWSNQTLNNMVFAVHADGTDDSAASWQSASTYTLSADDHINLKSLQSDSAGNVFAVVKTSFSNVGDPAIVAVACTTGDCTSASNWVSDTVYYRTGASQRTRPILLIDDTNRDLYVFMANSGGGPVRYKKSSIDTIDFSTAPEVTFIDYGGSVSDPTSTKQNLTGSTGLVVAASSSSYYYHNCMELTGATDCPDPNAAPVLQFSSLTHNVAEGAGTVTVDVTRIGSLVDPVSVDYTTDDVTAVAGSDYVSASNTLTFGTNESLKSIIVSITDDAKDEPLTELFDITLSNPTNGAQLGSTITTTINITDDDDPPVAQFSAANYNVGESDVEKTIAVTLSEPSELPITVDYATADDTATANADYTAASGQLTFAAGVTSQTFVVPILDDNIDEPAEDVALALTAASNATVNGSATLTIADDDPAPTAQFSATTAVVSEEVGSLFMTVALDKSSANVLSIDYETTDNGTAESGADFGAVNGTLTFNPGETSKDIEIMIFSNGSAESSETIELKLSNPQNMQLGAQDTAVITILDDDIVPAVEMTTTTLLLNEDVGNVAIMMTLSDASANTIEVTYAVNGGTATAGQDYDALAGTLVFAPGEISKSIMLTILDDAITEVDESVQLSITNATYSVPGESNPLTFTIKDNDVHYIYMPMIIRNGN